MSVEKEELNSEDVPGKFTEWLLSMGCPIEKVPNLDNVKQMSRGQYYIVWRNLMEEVDPKDTIRYKKLTVFCDDLNIINNSKENKRHKQNLIQPDELTLWLELTDLKEKGIHTESKVVQSKTELHNLVDKISGKLSKRNMSERNTRDMERRVFLLQRLTENLKIKKTDLQETITIANSLSYTERNIAIENKLDKCISSLRRQGRQTSASQLMQSMGNPVACSSIASSSSESDYDNNMASLVKCPSDALWPQLYEQRAGLCASLTQACAKQPHANTDKVTKSVLAHTEALHCSIALEALKNRAHVRQKRKMLAAAITLLNDYLSGDACEYLVLNCERTEAQSRVNTMRGVLEEMESRRGLFECDYRYSGGKNTSRQQISAVDKNILSKKEELKKLLQSLAVIERKIINIKECLDTVLNCSKSDVVVNNIEKYRDVMSLNQRNPEESISTMQQFYRERRAMQNKIETSFDLDLSENTSYFESTENGNPRFIDELCMYLQKFNLEKNRKLVLENGEKIWIHETVQSSLDRIYTSWQKDEVPSSFLCPSVNLARNLETLSSLIQLEQDSECILRNFECCSKDDHLDIDITSIVIEDNETVDNIKKRLNSNLISLQGVNRTLDFGLENLAYWNSNSIKQYISLNRTIDGKSYKDYENMYLYSLKL